MNKDQVYPLYVRNVLNTSILSSQDLKVLFTIRFTSIISLSKSSRATWAKPGPQQFLGLFITNSNNHEKKRVKIRNFLPKFRQKTKIWQNLPKKPGEANQSSEDVKTNLEITPQRTDYYLIEPCLNII